MAKTRERKVKDLMIPLADYDSIALNKAIRDAFEVMDKTGHHAILVLDENNEPIGQLTYRDILIGLEPKYTKGKWGPSWFTPKTFEDYPVFYYEGEFSGQCKAQIAKKVKEVMSPFDVSIDENATLSEAVHVMVTRNIGRMPVVSGGKFRGMIRLIEIFDEIKKVILGK
ncbi:MAG: CBS domain-containing protein [Deltaproteobacteria bacterium]|nr:CBS domain-containing protein [Deltaproteobacteria bacterium]